MGVGDAQDLEQALDRAVLADPPVEGVEDHVRARSPASTVAMSGCTSIGVTL